MNGLVSRRHHLLPVDLALAPQPAVLQHHSVVSLALCLSLSFSFSLSVSLSLSLLPSVSPYRALSPVDGLVSRRHHLLPVDLAPGIQPAVHLAHLGVAPKHDLIWVLGRFRV